jgi:hypothetical protein
MLCDHKTIGGSGSSDMQQDEVSSGQEEQQQQSNTKEPSTWVTGLESSASGSDKENACYNKNKSTASSLPEDSSSELSDVNEMNLPTPYIDQDQDQDQDKEEDKDEDEADDSESLRRKTTCPRCLGPGIEPPYKSEGQMTCKNCKGNRYVLGEDKDGNTSLEWCTKCPRNMYRTPRRYVGGTDCSVCGGIGVVSDESDSE